MTGVKVLTLDSLDQTPPNVLKIDVETGELAVLRGAGRLLANSRPTVICEVARENVFEATACLSDYTLYNGESGNLVNTAVWNTVAIPVPVHASRPLHLEAVKR